MATGDWLWLPPASLAPKDTCAVGDLCSFGRMELGGRAGFLLCPQSHLLPGKTNSYINNTATQEVTPPGVQVRVLDLDPFALLKQLCPVYA